MSNIESSDINDSDILTKTTQKHGREGQVQFFYELPSGRTINSEWVSSDNKKVGLQLWIAAVRENIVSDVRATHVARVEAAKAAQKAQPRVALSQEFVDRTQADTDPVPDVQGRGAVVNDPMEHAKNQVELLRAEEQHWLAAWHDAESKLKGARKALAKWNSIIAAFAAGDESVE